MPLNSTPCTFLKKMFHILQMSWESVILEVISLFPVDQLFNGLVSTKTQGIMPPNQIFTACEHILSFSFFALIRLWLCAWQYH